MNWTQNSAFHLYTVHVVRKLGRRKAFSVGRQTLASSHKKRLMIMLTFPKALTTIHKINTLSK